MRRNRVFLAAVFVGLSMIVLASGPATGAAEPPVSGEDMFNEYKCGMCHAVASAGIEAKVKSDTMKGADLGGYKTEIEADQLLAYVSQAGELDGKKHKKKYAGTPEELTAILAWLAQLDPAE